MAWQALIDGDSLVVHGPSGAVIGARWQRNRLHWHDRVYRLETTQQATTTPAEVDAAIPVLVSALKEVAPAGRAPLLFRVTLPIESPFVAGLQASGFLVARHVFEPKLDPRTVVPPEDAMDPGVELITLAAARKRFGDGPLEKLHLEVYARGSRLDPATPDRLDEADLSGLLLGADDLVGDLSCCLLLRGVPVGIVTVYRGADARSFELGHIGVAEAQLRDNEELTLAMLSWVIHRAVLEPWNAEQLTAEIDSDDPYTLYSCAALPLRMGEESVSLFLAPAWSGPEGAADRIGGPSNRTAKGS